MNQIELKKKIKLLAIELLNEKKYISSIDVLMRLNYLSKSDYEKWRSGKVDFLEKVCKANLSKLSLINSSLKAIGKEIDLKQSWTAYIKFGKGTKVKLRFSKSSNKNIERRYSTHYVKRTSI